MGTQNKRLRATGDLNSIEFKRMQLQLQIDANKSIEDRRRLGQFATPIELAKEIVSYGLSLQNDTEISFLEPAFGTGAFYSALLSEIVRSNKRLKDAVGIEIDDEFYDAAQYLWGNSAITLIHSDFTTLKSLKTANLLISNPPYVRHHYIGQTQKSKFGALAKEETGISLSGLAGLYCYFILLSHKWLAPNAISGWLIPSEFLDVNYGSTLKHYLLNNVHLLRVHRYNPANCKFDDALVSSCVVWFKNEIILDDYEVEFSYGGTHCSPEISKRIKKEALENHKKWTRLPKQDVKHDKLNNNLLPTLGDYFDIKRGLATGDNNFFILTKDQADKLNLDITFLTPILPSPRHLKCNEIFCDSDGQPKLKTQYFLLDCTLSEDELRTSYPSTWRYLCSGEETTAKKYLCRNRKIWYLQEHREATPFLCSYMGRSKNGSSVPFRFILNHTNAIATNSYLMLYPKSSLKEAILRSPDIMHTVWDILRGITASDLENEGRVYGGDLKKIEPKELSNVRCPQLAEIV